MMRARALVALAVGAAVAAAAPASAADPPPDAAIAPNGKRAAWVSPDGKAVWSARRQGRRWGPSHQLLTIRGTVRNLVFAPDSRRLAFENPRGEHGFVAVYRLGSERVLFVDPAFATDTGPRWSRDGRRISFIRHVDGVPDRQLMRPAPRRPARPAVSDAEPYPLAAALQAPWVGDLEASDDGRTVAYVGRQATDRGVFAMRAGERARRLVRYGGDDGQEVSHVAVAGHGGAVAYVRGSDPNDAGEIANPNSLVRPPQQQAWIVDVAGGAPRLLGTGTAPAFAPDDGSVIWVDGQRVMRAALSFSDGRLSDVGQPTQLFAFQGSVSALRFSPDGERLAYTRSEGDASHVEVYDLSSGTTSVVAPTAARDSRASWSPDGDRLAFLRVEPEQPFAIWVADAGTGAARQVWKAPPGIGSRFYRLDQEDQLLWSDDDRIAFPWEGDGWRHLYAVPVTGGDATLLTPGEGEVETAAVSHDRTRLVYATNVGDIGRRHLSSVSFGGGDVERVTGGLQSQWAPTPLADDGVAYIDAGWADPTTVTVQDARGATERAALPRMPASFPADEMVRPELIEFPATDGQTAYGQLFVPRPGRAKGCAVIFAHGGPPRQMLPGFHYIEPYTNLYEMNQYLTSQGCVVLSVDFRLGIMHGYAFRNAPDTWTDGAAEYRDILGAAAYLRSRPDVDPDRLAIHGQSYGGYLTGLALARDSDIFKVGVDLAGVHEFEGAAFPFSPVADIDTWSSPTFLGQGDDDRNVDFAQGLLLARLLQSRRPNVELEQLVFPDDTHEMTFTFSNLTNGYEAWSRFLLEHLGVRP